MAPAIHGADEAGHVDRGGDPAAVRVHGLDGPTAVGPGQLRRAAREDGLREADSTEFNPGTPHRVIFKLRELKGIDELGGTMRLGTWPCQLKPDSFAYRAYETKEIQERHRHRYEFNREYEDQLNAAGLRLTGETPDGAYVEICEIADHPWFLGCQFHPEFKSKPMEPHPLFKAFIGAAYRQHMRRMSEQEEPLFTRAD